MPRDQPQEAVPGLLLNQVWFMILKPKMVVLANGQPGYDAVGQYETMFEANTASRAMPGALIVMNVVVHAQPIAPAPSTLVKQ